MDEMESIAASIFPGEPHRMIALIQGAFVRTTVHLYVPDEELLKQILRSTEEMYRIMAGDADE